MRKGDLVKLSRCCFTTRSGGTRDYPLSNYANDTAGVVQGTRIATAADMEEWRVRQRKAIEEAVASGQDTFSITQDSGGESKLPPTALSVILRKDRVYTLLRARCRPQWSYRSHPGMALVLCTETGEEAYVKRDLLEVVQ
jgi:hypothetical protein